MSDIDDIFRFDAGRPVSAGDLNSPLPYKDFRSMDATEDIPEARFPAVGWRPLITGATVGTKPERTYAIKDGVLYINDEPVDFDKQPVRSMEYDIGLSMTIVTMADGMLIQVREWQGFERSSRKFIPVAVLGYTKPRYDDAVDISGNPLSVDEPNLYDEYGRPSPYPRVGELDRLERRRQRALEDPEAQRQLAERPDQVPQCPCCLSMFKTGYASAGFTCGCTRRSKCAVCGKCGQHDPHSEAQRVPDTTPLTEGEFKERLEIVVAKRGGRIFRPPKDID